MENGLDTVDRQQRHAAFRRPGANGWRWQERLPIQAPVADSGRSVFRAGPQARRTPFLPILQAYAKDKVVFLISHRLYHFPQMQNSYLSWRTAKRLLARMRSCWRPSRRTAGSMKARQEGKMHEELSKKAACLQRIRMAAACAPPSHSRNDFVCGGFRRSVADSAAAAGPCGRPTERRLAADFYCGAPLFSEALHWRESFPRRRRRLLVLFGQKMTHALRSEMSQKLTQLPASTLVVAESRRGGRAFFGRCGYRGGAFYLRNYQHGGGRLPHSFRFWRLSR